MILIREMIGHGFNIQSKYEWKGSKIDFFLKRYTQTDISL